MRAGHPDDVAVRVKNDVAGVMDQVRAVRAGRHIDLTVIGEEPRLEVDDDGERLLHLDGLSGARVRVCLTCSNADLLPDRVSGGIKVGRVSDTRGARKVVVE